MRDNPWHLRIPTTEHYQWYKNLVDLHELTIQWLAGMEAEQPPHFLGRHLYYRGVENLWVLDSLVGTSIENFMDDTQPEDMLRRLEQTIWSVQAWCLSALQNQTPSPNLGLLEKFLQQTARNLGTTTGHARWQNSKVKKQFELREILLALNDSPFSGFPQTDGFLMRRLTSFEIQIELRVCPHQLHFHEIKTIADQLCSLHMQWIWGFAEALNDKIRIEHVVQNPRCTQLWHLI